MQRLSQNIHYEIRELQGVSRNYYILILYGRGALKDCSHLERLGFVYDKISNSFYKLFYTKRKLEMALDEVGINNKIIERDEKVDSAVEKLNQYTNFNNNVILSKFCYGENENLFLLLKNFRYDLNKKCFYRTPAVRIPDIIIERFTLLEKSSFSSFMFQTRAKISLNSENIVPLSLIVPLNKNLQTTFLTVEQSISLLGKLNSFQVRQLLIRINNVFPGCLFDEFDDKEKRCKKLNALVIFS